LAASITGQVSAQLSRSRPTLIGTLFVSMGLTDTMVATLSVDRTYQASLPANDEGAFPALR